MEQGNQNNPKAVSECHSRVLLQQLHPRQNTRQHCLYIVKYDLASTEISSNILMLLQVKPTPDYDFFGSGV